VVGGAGVVGRADAILARKRGEDVKYLDQYWLVLYCVPGREYEARDALTGFLLRHGLKGEIYLPLMKLRAAFSEPFTPRPFLPGWLFAGGPVIDAGALALRGLEYLPPLLGWVRRPGSRDPRRVHGSAIATLRQAVDTLYGASDKLRSNEKYRPRTVKLNLVEPKNLTYYIKLEKNESRKPGGNSMFMPVYRCCMDFPRNNESSGFVIKRVLYEGQATRPAKEAVGAYA
jgi:hypothetical protein